MTDMSLNLHCTFHMSPWIKDFVTLSLIFPEAKAEIIAISLRIKRDKIFSSGFMIALQNILTCLYLELLHSIIPLLYIGFHFSCAILTGLKKKKIDKAVH